MKTLSDKNDYYIIAECNDIRLLEHGFTPGLEIKIYKKISGIVSICLRGTIIALRENEFEKISLMPNIHM